MVNTLMMNTLQVAGCSSGLGEPGNGSTTLILDNLVALEAGSALMSLPVTRLLGIRAVILSHAHFDHVCGLPFLVELHKQMGQPPLQVYGPGQALQTLKQHLFNDQLWPDFTRLPGASCPALTFTALHAEQDELIEGFSVVPVAVNHTVTTFGYFIQGNSGWIAYSGDTAACEPFGQALNRWPHLRHVITECSFPDSKAALAGLTGHMHSSNVRNLRTLIDPQVPLWVTSTKAWYAADIKSELETGMADPVVQLLAVGQELVF